MPYTVAPFVIAATAMTAGHQGSPTGLIKGRPTQAAGFALELDGKPAGMLFKFQPGPTSNPMGVQPSSNPGPLTMQLGLSMAQPVYEWINAAWKGATKRKNGAIVACDFNYLEIARLDFVNGLIEEVMIPSLDAGQSYPMSLAVRFRPERTVPSRVRGKRLGSGESNQRLWTCSNFRVSIGDLPCSKVSKVDALTIKQGINASASLNLHLPSTDAAAWQALAGKTHAPLDGKIEFLSSDRITVLGSLSFKMFRVRMVQPSPYGPSADGARSVVWTTIGELSLKAG